jgi:hypothetical protein
MNISFLKESPAVWLTESADLKMRLIVDLCDKEVGMLALCKKEGLQVEIYDILLPQQETTAVYCELSTDGIAKAAQDLPAEKVTDIRGWIHSHVNMGVSPSGTDNTQMTEFDAADYCVRGIINKQGSRHWDIYDYANGMVFKDVPGFVRNHYPSELIEQIRSELADKVREKTPEFKELSIFPGKWRDRNSESDWRSIYDAWRGDS